MAKRRAVKPKVVNGVHVNFEECKQAFRAAVLAVCDHVSWGKAYANKRKDGVQWKLWCLWRGSHSDSQWTGKTEKLFNFFFPFSTTKSKGLKISRPYYYSSARAWTHKSDMDRRVY